MIEKKRKIRCRELKGLGLEKIAKGRIMIMCINPEEDHVDFDGLILLNK